MKKLFLLFLIVPSIAFAQDNATQLMGLRMSAELAGKVDELYSSGIRQPLLPNSTPTVPIGSSTKRFSNVFSINQNQPVVIATMAATPVNTFGPIAVIPTAAANTGNIMPVPTIGNTVRIFSKAGATTLMWPGTSAEATPVAVTIRGFGTPVSAGTPAPMLTGKRYACEAISANEYGCSQGD